MAKAFIVEAVAILGRLGADLLPEASPGLESLLGFQPALFVFSTQLLCIFKLFLQFFYWRA